MFYSLDVDDIFSVVDFGILQKHFRLIRIELPGHGGSPLPESEERLTWQSVAADINEIAGIVGAGNFIVGGFSQGAGISIHVCGQNNQAEGLVLAMLPKIWSERSALRRTYWKLIAHLEEGNDKSMLERLFKHAVYIPGHLGRDGNLSERINQLMLKPPASAFTMILKGAILSDLPEIIPVHIHGLRSMIIGWDNDLNHPVSSFLKMVEVIRPDESVMIGSCNGFKQTTERLLSLFLQKL